MSKILVIGASGTVGTELVKNLRAKGHEVVRATSQSQLQKDQVFLNLVTQQGLESALDGVEKLFLLSPPGYTNQHEVVGPVIEKAKEKKLKKVVLMTAMGANAVESAPLRQAELKLEKSGLQYNIIRPNWFMQNFNTYWLQGIVTAGVISLPVGQAKTSFIDARDIASVAASLLDSDQWNNQAFDLTGGEALTHEQVAQLISETTGKKIVFQENTPDVMFENLVKAGVPQDYAQFMILILGFLKEGYSERTTDAVEKITGRKPITFHQYTQDYKRSWLSA